MEKAIPNPKLFISENFYTRRFNLKNPNQQFSDQKLFKVRYKVVC